MTGVQITLQVKDIKVESFKCANLFQVSSVVFMFERISCIFRVSSPVLSTLNKMELKNANRNGQI